MRSQHQPSSQQKVRQRPAPHMYLLLRELCKVNIPRIFRAGSGLTWGRRDGHSPLHVVVVDRQMSPPSLAVTGCPVRSPSSSRSKRPFDVDRQHPLRRRDHVQVRERRAAQLHGMSSQPHTESAYPMEQSSRIFSLLVDDLVMDAALQAHRDAAKSRAVCANCGTWYVAFPSTSCTSSDAPLAVAPVNYICFRERSCPR